MFFTIPNLLTSLNLFMGCCAIAFLHQHQFFHAFVCILIAGLADFLDGWVARMLKSSNSLGRELDSLADAVSFGVVPGTILYKLMEAAIQKNESLESYGFLAFSGFLISVAAVWRLAAFNLKPFDGKQFTGMPVPAQTIATLGLMGCFLAPNDFSEQYVLDFVSLLIFTLLFSYLMLSQWKFIKINFNIKHDIRQMILIIGTLLLAITYIWCSVWSCLFVICYYILVSLIFNIKQE